MVYFDDEASVSLKTITLIITAITAIAFGGMYFVYTGSQPKNTEPQTIEQAAPQLQAPSAVPAKPAVHTHV